jgi:hypothetical protein
MNAAEKKRLDREQAAKKVANKDGTAEPEEARRGAGDRLSEQPEGAVAGQPFEADFGADFFAHQEFGGGFGEYDAREARPCGARTDVEDVIDRR